MNNIEDNGQLLGIMEFQNGIKKGLYTDTKGSATLIINGSEYNTYSIHIDRRIVSSAGSLISFQGLLKEYGAENIKILYKERQVLLPSLEDYAEYKRQRDREKKEKKKK